MNAPRPPATKALVLAALVASMIAAPVARARGDEPRLEARAAIVHLIGEAGRSPDLAALVGELLAERRIATQVTAQARFEPDQLTDPQAPRALIAFVVMDDPTHVRLYFRAPSGERFLLRQLSLPSGLDAPGREMIGQVVESSVEALLQSATTGIDRVEVRRQLERERQVAAGPPPATTPPDAPRSAPRSRPWQLWLAIRYAGAWSGPELGAIHGPGIETGIARAVSGEGSRGVLFGATAIAERAFSQRLDAAALGAWIDTVTGRLLAGVDWRLDPRQALSARAGAGADFVQARPTAVRDAAVTLAGESSKVVPVARVEIGYGVGAPLWRVQLTLFADAPLERTRYEVQTTSGPLVVATPWSVRPGVTLAVGFSPRF